MGIIDELKEYATEAENTSGLVYVDAAYKWNDRVGIEKPEDAGAVSYTHLTLPTICSV